MFKNSRIYVKLFTIIHFMFCMRSIIYFFAFSSRFSLAFKDSPETGPILIKDLGNGYSITKRRMTQSRSLAYCESQGGRLAVMVTLVEAKKLIDMIAAISIPWTNETDPAQKEHEFGMARRYWIGLVDLVNEGEFVWQRDGTLLMYLDLWFTGQPDHIVNPSKSKNEHCVALWNPTFAKKTKHTFNDETCQNKLYSICQKMPTGSGVVKRSIRNLFKINDENSSQLYGVTLDDDDEDGGAGRSSSRESPSLIR